MKALIGLPILGVVLLVIQAQFLDEGSMKEIFSVVGVFLFLFSLMFGVAWFFCKATIDIFRREMRWVPIDGKINKVHVTGYKSSEGTHKSYMWSVEYMLFGSIKEKIFSSSHDALSGYLKGKHDGDKIQLYINPDNLEDIEHKRGLLHKIVLVCVSVFFSTFLGLFLFMFLEELIKKIK